MSPTWLADALNLLALAVGFVLGHAMATDNGDPSTPPSVAD